MDAHECWYVGLSTKPLPEQELLRFEEVAGAFLPWHEQGEPTVSCAICHMHIILSSAMEIIAPSSAPVKPMIGYNMVTPSCCVLLPVHARVGLKLSYLQVMLSPSLNYIALTEQD